MFNRKLNPNNVPSHIYNQLLKFKSLILQQLHYSDDEDFIEEDFTDENLLNGTPAPFMKVLHFTLNDWSSHIANLVLKLEYSFEEKTDWNFMETVFAFIRNIMKTQPGLSLEQFFSQGYTLPKLKMVNSTVQFLIKKHIELRKKANPPKRIPRRVLAQRSEQWVQQRQASSTQSPIKERQTRAQEKVPSAQALEKQKANVIPEPLVSYRSVDSLMTPNRVVKATPPKQIMEKSEVQGVPIAENVPLLTSPPSATLACPKLNPLPPALLRRVQDYRNARQENMYSVDAPSVKTSLTERSDSAQSSSGARAVHPKLPIVAAEDLPMSSQQFIHSESSPQQDVSRQEWKAFRDEAAESIRKLTKQIADLKSVQEANMLKCERRISELEKQNRELKSELALCSSRIEVMADRRPKFVKQYDRLRKPLTRSMGSRQENEANDETNLSRSFSGTMRPNSSLKGRSFTASRPHAVAYARPIARAATSSLAEKPVKSTSRGIERMHEV